MASAPLPFRARKIINNEAEQCHRAASSIAQSRKKRKKTLPLAIQAATNKAEELLGDTVLLPGSSSLTKISHRRTEACKNGELVKQVAITVTSLLKMEAIAAAVEHLKSCDAKLRQVIEAFDLPRFQICSSPFLSLARNIVYQQLATNAAAAIYNRLLILCGGESCVTPMIVSKLSPEELRKIGISARKASYLHDLSKNFLGGGLSDTSIMVMEDDELLSSLTAVKGIGVWSVHMFMIFSLHRPDVLPVGDLGVRKGFLKLYDLKSLPTPMEMEQLSAPWRPYRSLGAWYMWRLVEKKPPVLLTKEKG